MLLCACAHGVKSEISQAINYAWHWLHDHLWFQKTTRGEHGQDQNWISCRILAIFSDQDWIWIFIFEKNWIRTGSGYWFDFYNEIFLRVIQFNMSQMMVAVFSLLWFLHCQYELHSSQSIVIRSTLSQRWARIRTGSDWIRTVANFGRIRTGSDWEYFCCFNVIILKISKI